MANNIEKFDDWISVKKQLHSASRAPYIHEGEIWWCGCGQNVGIEINGKGQRFARPILILKKLSRSGFMGIPLTSQIKTSSWYYGFNFKEREQYAALCQARVISTARLYRKMGKVPADVLARINSAFLSFYK